MDVPDIYEALGSGRIVLPISAYEGLDLLGDSGRPLIIDKKGLGFLLVACMEDDEDFCGDYSSRLLYFGSKDGAC